MTLAPRAIGVSVLCPGFVRTQIMNSQRNVPQRLASAVEGLPTEGPVAEFVKVINERVSSGIDPLYVGELVREGIENDWPVPFELGTSASALGTKRTRQPRHVPVAHANHSGGGLLQRFYLIFYLCGPDRFNSRSARNTLLCRLAIHCRPLEVTLRYPIASWIWGATLVQ
jgi:hypothetical protein